MYLKSTKNNIQCTLYKIQYIEVMIFQYYKDKTLYKVQRSNETEKFKVLLYISHLYKLLKDKFPDLVKTTLLSKFK